MDHSGVSNTAVASAALEFNTFGEANTAIGAAALEHNTRGAANIAIGYNALYLNTTGRDNTATGNAALFGNKTGNANVADGGFALGANRTGRRNTATGYFALSSNTSLTSTHRTTFTVEFFANPTGDPSGSGEGQTFLGNTQVRTNASGTANINQLLSVTVQSGYAISSTATSPLGSTSEFSNDVTVQ